MWPDENGMAEHMVLDGRHVVGDVWKFICLWWKLLDLFQIVLKFGPKGSIDHKPAWPLIGDEPLHESMMAWIIYTYTSPGINNVKAHMYMDYFTFDKEPAKVACLARNPATDDTYCTVNVSLKKDNHCS